MKYFFLGERELFLAFSLVGVEGSVVANKQEAQEAFKHITGRGAAISGVPTLDTRPMVLIITEIVGEWLGEELQDWQLKGDYPLIVEVPGLQGQLQGKKSLTDSIREAVGIQI